jgi:hypothetical protein
MSKFNTIYKLLSEEFGNKDSEGVNDKDVEMMRRAKDRVDKKKSNDPVDRELSKKYDELLKSRKDLASKMRNLKEADISQDDMQGMGDDQPRDNPNSAEMPQSPDNNTQMTSEGEAFLTDLARKAIFANIQIENLTPEDRAMLVSQVTPENAKSVAEVIQKLVSA